MSYSFRSVGGYFFLKLLVWVNGWKCVSHSLTHSLSQADGFTHMTADPTKLVDVLNHFYKQVEGDWVCLKTNADTLRGGGIELTFEETAPVGDIEVIDTLFDADGGGDGGGDSDGDDDGDCNDGDGSAGGGGSVIVMVVTGCERNKAWINVRASGWRRRFMPIQAERQRRELPSEVLCWWRACLSSRVLSPHMQRSEEMTGAAQHHDCDG